MDQRFEIRCHINGLETRVLRLEKERNALACEYRLAVTGKTRVAGEPQLEFARYTFGRDLPAQIFHDAFTGTAAGGGAAGIAWATVIQTGVKRAAFSNEAGLGTAPLAHGAAIAEWLNARALNGELGEVVIAADPKTLGQIRRHCHKEVARRIVGELAKDLVNSPVKTIEQVLAEA